MLMQESLAEQLTSQFYQWELLGRGWLLSDEPVGLEPPFTPFFGHFPWYTAPQSHQDDGLRHTWLSRMAAWFDGKPKEEKPTVDREISYQPVLFDDDEPITVFQIQLQSDGEYKMERMEALLAMLCYCTRPVSFEFVGTCDRLYLQLTCRESDAHYVKAHVSSCFPDLSFQENSSDWVCLFDEDWPQASIDYGLSQEFTRPLLCEKGVDPLRGLLTMLSNLDEAEVFVFQVLFNGVVHKWDTSILRAVTDSDDDSFFSDAPEMLQLARQKVAKPLLAVTVRTLAFAYNTEEAYELLQKVDFVIRQSFVTSSNSLVPLLDTDYRSSQRFSDIRLRRSHRCGMLLNSEELSLIAHVPPPSFSLKLLDKVRKTKLPPSIATGGTFLIGVSEHSGEAVPVSLNAAHRLKHTHIIGATGTGKSTLLSSMIIQDMEQGNGVALLDPHGDLIETVLNYVPEHRAKDVVLFDPSDSEYPVGFNILQAHTEIEKETLSSDLVAAFKRLSTSWGDQMHSVLSNALLAFLNSSRGGTLLDLRRYLLETPFRNEFLRSVDDYSILYYWQKQYPLLKTASIGPILTRLDHFLRSRLIRNMVGQQKGIDFSGILDRQKILLVKLSQGLIGEENAYLLGSFLVSKIHQAALARQGQKERKDFFFYVDEFQHFVTPSLCSILSGARKYHLGLVLAHQDLQQLSRGDGEIASSLLSNAGTRICFRVSEADSKKLAEGFSYFEGGDLQNLGTGEAVGRVEKPDFDFSLTTMPLPQSTIPDEVVAEILANSRKRYAIDREIVESELLHSILPTQRQVKAEDNEPVKKETKSEVDAIPFQKKEKVPERNVKEVALPVVAVEKIKALTQQRVKQKEESRHRYLQNLLKKVGESKGFTATIEASLPSKEGKVDVLLQRNGTSIACEVSVTTGTTWEVHNVQKCIAAGYQHVISCASEAKQVAAMQKKVEACFTPEEQTKIKVMEVEALVLYLDTVAAGEVERKTTFKGYRVNVSHTAVSSKEDLQRKQSIAKIVGDALKKKG